MSFSDLLKEKGIDVTDIEKVSLLQNFYQEGYLQGCHDNNPNYEYSLKYKEVVERVLELFNMTGNPISLGALEMCLNNLDQYKKEHGLF